MLCRPAGHPFEVFLLCSLSAGLWETSAIH